MSSNNYELVFFDKSDEEIHKTIYSGEYTDREFIEAALDEQRYRNAIKSMNNFNSFLDPEIVKLLKRENIFPVAVNRKIWEEAIRRKLIERTSYDEERYRNSTRRDGINPNSTNPHHGNYHKITETPNRNTVRNEDGRNIPLQRFNDNNDQGYKETPYRNSVRNDSVNTSNNLYNDQGYHDPYRNPTPKTVPGRINSINHTHIGDQGISLNRSLLIKICGLMALAGFLFLPVAGGGGISVIGYDLMGMNEISDTVILFAGIAMICALIIIFVPDKAATFFCSLGGIASLLIAFLIITNETNSADKFGISGSIDLDLGSYVSMLGFIISGILSVVRNNFESESYQTAPLRNVYSRDKKELSDRNSNVRTDLRNILPPAYNRNNDPVKNLSYRNTYNYKEPVKRNVNSKSNEIEVIRIPKYLFFLAGLFLIFSLIMIFKPTIITHFLNQTESRISAGISANREVYYGHWINKEINQELIITPKGTSNYSVTLRYPSESPGEMDTVAWDKFTYENGSISLGGVDISYSNGKITYKGEVYEKVQDQ